MKIIITGASGFIGQALCRKLLELGHDVTPLSSKDADLTQQDSLSRFDKIKYDRIFHLAAWTQAGDFCIYHPGEQWLINQQISTTVLTWWQKFQPQAKLVSFGTSCSYPEIGELKEHNYLLGEPIKDLYVYAMTKRMLLIGQQALNRQFDLNYLTVVPSTVYGPNYNMSGKQLHFIFDLTRKILDLKHKNQEVVLWGDGYQRRELVFIEDFIQEMLELDISVENDIVNIGAGEDYSIREFAGKICNIIGIPPSSIQYDTTKYVGAKSKKLDNTKLDCLLPHKKRTSLEEGLKVTVEFMEKALYPN
jgi:GDP-L-fucose synthase